MMSVDVKDGSTVDKIREFYISLNDGEQAQFWSLMTSLRGPDNDGWKLKNTTTARLRYAILGDVETHGYQTHGWDISGCLEPTITSKEAELLGGHHFENHLRMAQRALELSGSKFKILKDEDSA